MLFTQRGVALPGSDLQDLVKWADSAGYVYNGVHQIQAFDLVGHPVSEEVFLFSRLNERALACVRTNVSTLRDAQMQFIGSVCLSHYIESLHQ